MRLTFVIILIALSRVVLFGQEDSLYQVSNVHPKIYYDQANQVQFFLKDTTAAFEVYSPSRHTLDQMQAEIVGTNVGLYFDFKDENLNGKLIFGFIHPDDSKHPQPVYFKLPLDIVQGKVAMNIKHVLRGTYDMVGWEENKKGTLGYRVVRQDGAILYDGQVTFKGNGPFEVDVTLVEGPNVNLLNKDGATIAFKTNMQSVCEVIVDNKSFKSDSAQFQHEIKVDGLDPDTEYGYTVKYGNNEASYSFKTAPEPGTRKPFTFAYASDSRAGKGAGERDIFGTNAYIMKKISALAHYKGVSFFQFTGDMINGYLTSVGDMELQYANWKKAVEPYWHYYPFYVGMGNHESLKRMFKYGNTMYEVDRYPYSTESAEAIFSNEFVNPMNGPESEDGATYDPSPTHTDFPSYKENVFYYTYDNVAVINLNSDYWYAPSKATIPDISGGLHGYIMDNQLKWFKKTLKTLEKDSNIDHIFITEHTPFFPNGGHVHDDMWYHGDNSKRPYVAGKPLRKGIIERRDELLDLIVNNSVKTIAILTGDEHNYCRTEVGPETIIYPDNWEMKKLELTRTIYQINNGAAGAPYYSQQETPWTPFTTNFTTQNALVIFHVDGAKVEMEVLNPDTLETIEEFTLR
jgi:3',5'-cyclic AMP phosphodiesterase CpdA